MNPLLNVKCGFVFLLLAAMIPARAGVQTEKVIAIEAAMRACQERAQKSHPGSRGAWWYPNKKQVEPGAYPDDGFYCEDLRDPDFAATLVDNLFWEVYMLEFVEPATASAKSPVAVDIWDLYPDEGITAANHRTVFEQLVRILNSMRTVRVSLLDLGLAETNRPHLQFGISWCSTLTGLGRGCSDQRLLAVDSWKSNGCLGYVYDDARSRTTPFMRQHQTYLQDSTTGAISTEASVFTVNARQWFRGGYDGVARIYAGRSWNVVRVSRLVEPLEPHTLAEETKLASGGMDEPTLLATIDGSQSWTSGVVGPTEDDVLDFGEVPCESPAGTTVKKSMTWPYFAVVDLNLERFVDEIEVPCSTCVTCESGDCPPGAAEFENECIRVSIALGSGSAGSFGSLHIDAEEPGQDLANPGSLRMRLGNDTRAIVDLVDGRPIARQIHTANAVVDVVEQGADAYEVRYYHRSVLGERLPDRSFVISGTPFRTIRVENMEPGRTPVTGLRFTVSGGDVTRETHLYRFEIGSGWTLESDRGGVLTTERRMSSTSGDLRIEEHEILGADGRVESRESLSYRVFPWNLHVDARVKEELVAHSVGSDPDTQTTMYEFHEDPEDPLNYGRVRLRIDPSGTWSRFKYDAAGRIAETVSPLENAPSDAETGIRIERRIVHGDDYEERVEILVDDAGAAREVSRGYSMFDYNRIRTITCTRPGAGTGDTSNLVSTTNYVSNGPWMGRVERQREPDGTGVIHHYAREGEAVVTTTYSGAFGSTGTTIVQGTKSVVTVNSAGSVTREAIYDIASGLLVSERLASTVDEYGRVTRFDFNDGSSEVRVYGCCGLESLTDRTGVATAYQYDGARRLIRETRGGVSFRHEYDVMGRRTRTFRVGSDASEMLQTAVEFDSAGRIVSTTDAGGRVTVIEETRDAQGQRTRTTTFPGGGTKIERFALSGHLESVSGTAVYPAKFKRAVDADGLYSMEIRLSEAGAETEWIKSYFDFAGRPWRTLMPDGARFENAYNGAGKRVSEVDPDGVVTLYAYNPLGEVSMTAIDINLNGLIDLAGPDRVLQVNRRVLAARDTVVQETSVTQWEVDDSSSGTVTETQELDLNGHRSWLTRRGLVTEATTSFESDGVRRETITAPDGRLAVSEYHEDRLVHRTLSHPSLGRLTESTYGYDAHGRLRSISVEGGGTTTATYFEDDQLHTHTTADPDSERVGDGYDAQTTTFVYDEAGRLAKTIQPDGGEVVTEYYGNGLVRRVSGSRTYRQEFTYDAQGRTKTLTTWQDSAAGAGIAVTTWDYDPARGWLVGKRYADGRGPSYTYWPSGRVKTRTWARGGVTAYDYSAAGELSSIDYNDNTPDVRHTYDRLGRLLGTTDAAGTLHRVYGTHDRLEDETYSGTGYLSGQFLMRGHDDLARPIRLSVPSAPEVGYSYDAASRLQTITRGADKATYAYAPGGARVASITVEHAGQTRLVIQKDYDRLNRLVSVRNSPAASSAVLFEYTYNSANQRIRATREDGASWGYDYDSLGQVTGSIKRTTDGVPVLGLEHLYQYDDIGNRTSTTVNGRSSTYHATLLNQYAERTIPGYIDVMGTAHPEATVTANLEPTVRQDERFLVTLPVTNSAGPVWAAVNIAAVRSNQGDDGEDAIADEERRSFVPQSPEVFAHDSDGNLIRDGQWTYIWDGENRLAAMETRLDLAAPEGPLPVNERRRLEFGYDGGSRRIAKKVYSWDGATWIIESSRVFLYDGWTMVAEYDVIPGSSAPVLHRSATWGTDLSGSRQGAGGVGGLLFIGSATETMTPAYDGGGNVIAVIDTATGSIGGEFEYGAFGEPLMAIGPQAPLNPFRFSTKYTDPECDLVYYGFRYYSSSTGRWLSRDPIQERGGANLFGMIGNDPLARIDFLGLTTFDELFQMTLEVSYICRGKSPLLDAKFRDITAAMIAKNKPLQEFLEEFSGNAERFEKISSRLTGTVGGVIEAREFLQFVFQFKQPHDSMSSEEYAEFIEPINRVIGKVGQVGQYASVGATLMKGDPVEISIELLGLLKLPGGDKILAFGPSYLKAGYKGAKREIRAAALEIYSNDLLAIDMMCACDSTSMAEDAITRFHRSVTRTRLFD